MKRLNKKKSFVLLGILIAFCVGGWVVMANPFKVTDPNDPRFDPMEFDFKNYHHKNLTVREVFPVLFPIGTSKDYVDKVLVQAGKAKSYQSKTNKSEWIYKEPLRSIEGPPIHVFIFDENDQLINIKPGTGSGIY
jgi:hypothetical protein